jgi:outer membrane protein assembly factor BamB
MRRRRLVLLALFLAWVAPSHAAVPTDANAWTSYGFDNQLTNGIQTRALTLGTVPKLRLDWSQALDGPILASPLSANVLGQQLVFAATEAGTVYAVDADTGTIVWQRSLGAVATPECGTWGITSTGAIDLDRQTLFEIGADGELHALDVSTGEERPGYPLTLIENNMYEYVWGGLRIAADRLYVGVASYCDVGPPGGPLPEGRLLAVPLADPSNFTVWDPVPGPGNMGGMWGWGGVSVEPSTGNVFTALGNSTVWSDECACYVDDAGYGDHVVNLLPDLSEVLDADDPGIPSTGDSDFGAAPLLFHPGACPALAAANNKDGALYVWDRNHLADGPLLRLPLGDGIAPFVGAPAWSESKQMVYVGQSTVRGSDGARLGNGVTAWHVDPGCGFRPIWQAAVGDGSQATPLVAGNVVFATGGKPGGFFALDAATGKQLWAFPTDGRTVAAIISAGGQVFGADTAGVLYGFGAPPGMPPPCGPSCFRS